MSRFHLPLFSLVAVLVLPLAAHADTDQFSFTSPVSDTFSFILPSSPTPDTFDALSFTLDARPIVFNGTAGIADLQFLDDPTYFIHLRIITAAGPYDYESVLPLFTGSTAAPTFILGSVTAADLEIIAPIGKGVPDYLVISDLSDASSATPASPVPEPPGLLLLLTGVASSLVLKLRHHHR